MNIENGVTILTGATGGIGSAIAKKLDAEGMALVLVGRQENELVNLQQKLAVCAGIIVADVSQPQGRKRIADYIVVNKAVRGLINLAGTMNAGLYKDQSDEQIYNLMQTNLIAPMLLSKIAIQVFENREQAFIVNVGSIFGSIGHPGFSAYCASKAGLRCFTEALRRELADQDIKIFYLAPRATDTKLNDDRIRALNQALKNKIDEPRCVAEALFKMLKQERFEVYMGWPEKLFVKINALRSKWVDQALYKKIATIKANIQ